MHECITGQFFGGRRDELPRYGFAGDDMTLRSCAPKFPVGINRLYPHTKLGPQGADGRWGRFNGGFVPETQNTSASLLKSVENGYAFSPWLGGCQREHCGQWCCPERRNDSSHCGRPKGYRLNRHFIEAQHIGLDFDNGDRRSTLDYLLDLPLIAEHSAFVYTTLSHTPECPKARVVFITDGSFSDAGYYRRAKRAVMAALPWGDAGVHDPCRFFYGTDPKRGTTRFLDHILPLAVVDELIQEQRAELDDEQARRELPHIPSSRVIGHTPAERYVNAAVQQEVAWLASRVEGTGERHKGLLLAALKLGSLAQSEWLPAEVRLKIDPFAVLLPASRRNGYVAKYGEGIARRTIADGMAYSNPRQRPESWESRGPRIVWSGQSILPTLEVGP